MLTLATSGCGSSSSNAGPSNANANAAVAATTAPGTGTSSATPTASATTSSQPYAPPQTSFTTPSTDPGTLPQTKTLPTDTDPQFTADVNALWQGIVDDNPQEAMPFFFPKSAYLQVKAISDAGSDYENRLIGFYKLDIHAAHRLLESSGSAKDAKLVGVSVPAKAAEWIRPGEEENKLSYYRVYGARLTYTEGGKTKSFGLFSLISWRGRWYVVHLGPNPRPKTIGVVYQPRG